MLYTVVTRVAIDGEIPRERNSTNSSMLYRTMSIILYTIVPRVARLITQGRSGHDKVTMETYMQLVNETATYRRVKILSCRSGKTFDTIQVTRLIQAN